MVGKVRVSALRKLNRGRKMLGGGVGGGAKGDGSEPCPLTPPSLFLPGSAFVWL